MKIRGSLNVTKDLILGNTGDSSPAEGLVAVSNHEGLVSWARISFPEVVAAEIYKLKGTPVIYENKLYISKISNALGQDIENPVKWEPVGSSQQSDLTADQLAAIEGANSPEAANPFATIADIINLTIAGTDTIDNIKVKSALIKNVLWITSTDGVDSSGNAAVAGDGIISTGTGWFNIGPFRGPTGVGLPGEEGPIGPAGPMQTSFVYTQATPAGTWVIAHNLNRYPSVTVVNSAKDTIESTVNYVDENSVVVTVFPITAGFAYIN